MNSLWVSPHNFPVSRHWWEKQRIVTPRHRRICSQRALTAARFIARDRCARPVADLGLARSAPGAIKRRPTGKPSEWSKRCRASGRAPVPCVSSAHVTR